MEGITALIREVKSKRNQIKQLQEELNISLKPILSDISLMSTIYAWYKDIYPMGIDSSRESCTRFNLCFIFIILLLYSPQILIDSKIKFGIRDEIARVLGYAPCTISGYLQKVEFFYERYKDYKETIDFCCAELYNKLKEEQLLPKERIFLH